MLSKLFKHEMKASSRLLLPIYMVLIVLTIMDRIVLSLDIFDGLLAVIPGFITFAYIVSLIAIVIVSTVIIIIRFYKNLMTDEGYLMFTIPVKTRALINSKMFAAIIWTVASFVAVVASLLAVFATSERIEMLVDVWNMVWAEFEYAFGDYGTIFIIELIISIILGLFNNVLQIYASIALGQLFNGHKVLGSFAAYIAITMAIQTVSTVIFLIAGFVFPNSFENTKSLPYIIIPATILFTLVTNVAYYLITEYMFKKKLNLD